MFSPGLFIFGLICIFGFVASIINVFKFKKEDSNKMIPQKFLGRPAMPIHMESIKFLNLMLGITCLVFGVICIVGSFSYVEQTIIFIQ